MTRLLKPVTDPIKTLVLTPDNQIVFRNPHNADEQQSKILSFRSLQAYLMLTICIPILLEIAATIQNANKRDLQNFLEILNITHDKELLVKLFSILAVYLVSYGRNTDVIVSYKHLYDRVQDLLSIGFGIRTAKTLNFVSALLSIDDKGTKGKSLALYARNMIRVSGCLSTMSHLFAGCMMYQDTWIALCQCLAEACRDSEVNQSYCSQLVPLCVKKCHQDNVLSLEVCTLLHNLLHKHDRNTQLFLESNGISIFTREMLQFNICMQLLNAVVETSTETIAHLRETNVVYHLGDFLNSYGPYSQIGQWSTIILYNFDLRRKGSEEVITAAINNNKSGNKIKNTTLTDERSQGVDDTVHLFQNVMKEIVNWQSQKEFNFKTPLHISKDGRFRYKTNKSIRNNNNKKPFTLNPHTDNVWPRNARVSQIDITMTNIEELETDLNENLSFSSLIKYDMQIPRRTYYMNEEQTSIYSKCCEEMSLTLRGNLKKENTQYTKSVNRNVDACNNTEFIKSSEMQSVLNLTNFKPTFASTPKKKQQNTNTSKVSTTSRLDRSSVTMNDKRHGKKVCKIYKQKKYNISVSPMKEIKNRSLSARLFSAINDSCTTFVKSVKSIFRKKENAKNQEIKVTEHSIENYTQCSYSFTKYMRKRDAVLRKECTSNQNTFDDAFSIGNSCRTCNDTIILKHKLSNDKFLKRTLTKLKLGINLYGCDFNKISKALWPRKQYMTPDILCNLYRKLIVKE